MEESKSPLAGRRYICLARCSTNQQEEKSIPDQLQVLHDYAQKHGMIHAGDDEQFHLGGISGSHPAARTDIEQIIERKKTVDDFSVLLVQDLSRLTRGGVEHGGKIEFDLAAAGIKVVFAGTHLPDGDHAGIVKSVEYYSAQQHAKSVSFGVARGQMSAILAGKQTHCLVPAYGIDRLYLTADAKPSCIIRNLPDGRQQRINPETLRVEQVYPMSMKGQPRIRYGKQAGEKIVLIPGDPEIISIIRQMFRWTLIEGWGDFRVARALNDLGIPSPRGKRWQRNNVKVILRNPIYVGRGIGNRRTAARYNKRSRSAPTKVPYELTDLASRKKPQNKRRPISEWIEQEHELLKNFLGDDLHDLAVAY